MICRIVGSLEQVSDQAIVVRVGGLSYEVLVPGQAITELSGKLGEQVTLWTLEYLEGSPALGNLTPRMVGFLSEQDRAFFALLTRVKGISTRKALRAMSMATGQIARAVESGDVATLSRLPEVGKKTAAALISELRGQLGAFVTPGEEAAPARAWSEAQRVALDILVQWGDRRADAQRWVAAAVEAQPSLSSPEEIVKAAYQWKGRI